MIAGGIGGRLVMRLSALMDPASLGFRTENGNRIGDVTTDGTLALVVFGGLFAGIAAATEWVVARPWLPERRLARHGAAAVAAVGLTGFTVIEGNNRDFLLLEPAPANVAMFLAIVAGAGLLTVWFDAMLVARWRGAPGVHSRRGARGGSRRLARADGVCRVRILRLLFLRGSTASGRCGAHGRCVGHRP